MKAETICYEALPYLYGFTGWASLRNTDSLWLMSSGALLLISATLIMRMRWVYRTRRCAWRRRYKTTRLSARRS